MEPKLLVRVENEVFLDLPERCNSLIYYLGMTGFIGTTCLVAFVLTSGASDKTKSE